MPSGLLAPCAVLHSPWRDGRCDLGLGVQPGMCKWYAMERRVLKSKGKEEDRVLVVVETLQSWSFGKGGSQLESTCL